MTHEADVARMVDETFAALGGLDGLVLNVGIGAGGHWLEGTTAESWDKTFAINIRSHMLTVKAALPRMEDGVVDRLHFLDRRADRRQPHSRPMTPRRRACSACAVTSPSKARVARSAPMWWRRD